MIVVGLAASAQCGCLVDSEDRCGKHQVLDGELCACVEGYGLVGNHCVACGENEVGTLDGCECAPGFGRTDPAVACKSTGSLGEACSTDDDCAGSGFVFCASSGEAGYCTRPDCASSADCSNDYSCNTWGARSFCERPSSGAGVSCQTSQDCAGFEAAYCETTLGHVCLKNGCQSDPSVCPGDWVCCDIMLIGESLCLPPAQLDSGACPGGGELVPRAN